MNKIVLKIGLLLIIFIATIQGSAYLFNHVDPWLSIGVTIVGITCFIALIVNIIKSKLKSK